MSGPPRSVGLAVLGLGRIGELHARNVAERVRGARLVAVADLDAARARRLAAELGCDAADGLDALTACADVDGVVLATPVASHLELIRACAAAGTHVLCEKPLSFDVEGAIALVEELREAPIVLQVGFHRRFDPDYAEARRRLAQGELGRPYLLRTSMRDMAPPPQELIRAQVGGFVVDATGHDFDALRWLAGEIVEVTAFGAALSAPLFAQLGDHDNLLVAVRFASGALGVIDNSRVAGYGFECSTEVLGSAGTLRIGAHRRHALTTLRDGHEGFERVTDFAERFDLAYPLELEAFAAAIRTGAAPRVSGEDGVAALVLSEAAQVSLESGRTVSLADHPWYGRLLATAA